MDIYEAKLIGRWADASDEPVEMEIHRFDQDSVAMYIHRLRDEFIYKHRCEPRYIKLPMWVYRGFCRSQAIWATSSKKSWEKLLMNMIACPTESIDKIEQIEVF